jgi:KDO2-lipid IV(A) lauroyltransferase
MARRIVTPNRLESLVTFEGLDNLDAVLARGNGAIMAIGHTGNWEISGIATAARGYPLSCVARQLDNPLLNKHLIETRMHTGMEIIYKQNATREGVRALKRNRMLVLLADQDARKSGIFVDFFGRPASTVRGPAVLSLKYDAPIIPTNIYRVGPFRHHVHYAEPIEPAAFRDLENPTHAMTQAHVSRLEGFIRQHPEQWLWMHRRWKTQPKPVDSGP